MSYSDGGSVKNTYYYMYYIAIYVLNAYTYHMYIIVIYVTESAKTDLTYTSNHTFNET